MKRSLILLTALALSGSVLAEPPAGGPPGGPPQGPPIERIAKDLDLDANQTAELKRILEAQHAKMDADRAQFESSGTRPSREEMQAKHAQMDADLHQQLSAVLTSDQLARFEAMRKHRGPPGPPPGENDPSSGDPAIGSPPR